MRNRERLCPAPPQVGREVENAPRSPCYAVFWPVRFLRDIHRRRPCRFIQYVAVSLSLLPFIPEKSSHG